MKRAKYILQVMLAAVILLCGAVGCATDRRARRASVVDYLYPKKQEFPGEQAPINPDAIPALHLPLTVGVAFVPDAGRGYGCCAGLSEVQKRELLCEVSSHFEELEFVGSIETIPSAYLAPKGGFGNVDQIATMYGLDIIALISYDQTQFTDEGVLSLAYLTIVGAYVVAGEKNDTHTMLDTTVYDIPSRKLLFRAPGVSQIKGRATRGNLRG